MRGGFAESAALLAHWQHRTPLARSVPEVTAGLSACHLVVRKRAREQGELSMNNVSVRDRIPIYLQCCWNAVVLLDGLHRVTWTSLPCFCCWLHDSVSFTLPLINSTSDCLLTKQFVAPASTFNVTDSCWFYKMFSVCQAALPAWRCFACSNFLGSYLKDLLLGNTVPFANCPLFPSHRITGLIINI